MKLNRTIYRGLLIVSFLAMNALIIFGISSVWSYLNTGADRSSMLHLPRQLSANYSPKVEWSPLGNEGRPMEKQTLGEIQRDYIKAWYIRNLALETNSTYGIADYYTDSARVKLFRILDLNRQTHTTLKTTTLRHYPKLEFYSADGKMVIITDKNVTRYEEIYVNTHLILKRKQTASYQVMLLLEDGFWRIRHLVEIPSSTTAKKETVPKTSPPISSIAHIKGVNYYPKQHPWNMFGTTFSDSTVNADFKRIGNMGLNAVRIFVPYEAFGKAVVDRNKLNQLIRTLDLAAKNNLKVTVTLFDFYGDYRLKDWTLTHRHLEQIVQALKGHSALQAWDIKNEPDLDFKSRGKERVLAWLGQMIFEIKSWDNTHPVTIGWSSPEAALNLKEKVDFISFHYYRKPANFLKAYETLKASVKTKPILLQEYGYSSYDGFWNAYLGSEEDQASYFKEMKENLKYYKIPFMFWTLYDFETVPNSVVGKLPWRKERQKYFGIFNVKGEKKPVYKVLKVN